MAFVDVAVRLFIELSTKLKSQRFWSQNFRKFRVGTLPAYLYSSGQVLQPIDIQSPRFNFRGGCFSQPPACGVHKWGLEERIGESELEFTLGQEFDTKKRKREM